MKINPPPEIQDYRYDEASAGKAALLPRIFGWLTVLALVVLVYTFKFMESGQRFVMPVTLLFFLLFTGYIIAKIKTRPISCSRCGGIMDVIDTPWTPDQWKQIMGYDLVGHFTGADGFLYSSEKEKRSGSVHYFIHGHQQRWIACHQCRLCFLHLKYIRESLFSTIYKEEFKETRNYLLTDPKARQKIKSAWEERLGISRKKDA